MSDLRKAAEMALEFVEWFCGDDHSVRPKHKAPEIAEALRQALAQPEQEPVAWGMPRKDGLVLDVICPQEHSREPGDYTIPLYTAPPKREWVGLTDEEVESWRGNYDFFDSALVREVEAKLKEKNT